MLHFNDPVPFSDSIAIDIETSGLDPYTNKLLLISIADRQGNAYLITNPACLESVKKLLVDPDVLKIAHNATFDIKWLRRYFKLDRIPNLYCTMQAEKLIYMGWDFGDYPATLSSTVARHTGFAINKSVREEFIDHPGFNIRPITADQIRYAKDDVIYLHRVMDSQLMVAEHDGLGNVFDLENFLINATASLELGGQKLDMVRWLENLAFMTMVINDAQAAMHTAIGDYELKYVTKKGKENVRRGVYDSENNKLGINFNSRDQLMPLMSQLWGVRLKNAQSEYIQSIVDSDLTPAGAREFLNNLLKIKQWSKWVGYDLPKYVNPVSGKCHPQFNPLGTVTGRYSSNDYNAQNIPRPQDGLNMRHCLVADSEDHVIIRCDYAQQEVRVGAAMSGDKALMKACMGEDIYAHVGSDLFNKPITKADPERQIAKGAVLAMMYGAGEERLMKATGQGLKDVRKVKNAMKQAYPQMFNYGRRVEQFYNNNGYIATRLGRRRYNVESYSEFCNSPIQGTSADMMKIAMANFEEDLYNRKQNSEFSSSARLWTAVHDEIGVHCRIDEADRLSELITKHMVNAANMLVPEVAHYAELSKPEYRWDK